MLTAAQRPSCEMATSCGPALVGSVATTRPEAAPMTLAVLSFRLLVTMVPAGRSAGCAGGTAPTIRAAAVVAAARRTPNRIACPRESTDRHRGLRGAARHCLTERASARD